jgi:hypothetical protein
MGPAATGNSLASIDIRVVKAGVRATTLSDSGLEATRQGNPAARSLPLLAALARGIAAEVVLDYVGGTSLHVRVAPCS